MSVDSTKLVIPGHGTAYVAPVNTLPPSNPLGASGFKLSEDGPGLWKNLGHTSKQNTIAFTKEGGEKETIDTFLADAVRTSSSSVTWGVNIAALQFDENNLRLAFNGDFDPATGGYTVTSPKPVNVALFLYFQDSTGALGFWLPSVDISLGDAPSVDTANFFELPLSATILSVGSGVIAPVDGSAGLFQIFKTSFTNVLTHTVNLTGTPTGGTFKLLVNGNETGTIAYNATNTTVQTAINAVGGAPTATVTGTAPTFSVAFAAPGAALAAGTNALTGTGSPQVVVTAA